jgi:colicin import membrane protein
MAKKGQRRATHKRQTRKIRKNKMHAPFSDARVAQSWDRTRTLLQNYEALGLVADVNALPSIPHAAAPEGGAAGVAAALDAAPPRGAATAAIAANPDAKFPHEMPKIDADYFEALMVRHGLAGRAAEALPPADDDAWRKMARDEEANYRQESAQRLATRCLRLARFKAEKAAHARALREAADAEEQALLAGAAGGGAAARGLKKKNKGGAAQKKAKAQASYAAAVALVAEED